MTAESFLAEVIRCFAAWWWLAAALGKLRSWTGFRGELATSFGLAPAAAMVAAPALVCAELLAAALLLAAPAAGMRLSLVLMASFTAVLGYQFLARGLVRCSCFGESERPLSAHDLLRNGLVLGAMAGWLALAPTQPLAGELRSGELLVAAGLGAWLCVAAVNFHDLAVLAKTR